MATFIDLRDVELVLDFIRDLEKHQLSDINWVRNGQVIEIDPATLEEWKFLGLANRDFARILIDDGR